MKNRAVVVLDETGSMGGQEDRVVGSMNEYVATLPDDVRLTVFKFDSHHYTQFFKGQKPDWKRMTVADYNPGAATPLYDAVGKALAYADTKAKKGDKVLIMIDTDGHENASKEHTFASIKAMVDKRKAEGWEFLFMANAMTEDQAKHIGNVGGAMGMSVNSAAYSNRSASYGVAASQTAVYFAPDTTTTKNAGKDAAK